MRIRFLLTFVSSLMTSFSAWAGDAHEAHDAWVIALVLSHFADRTDTETREGVILLRPKTWSVGPDGEPTLRANEDGACPIDHWFREAWEQRNRKPQSAAPMVKPSRRWRLMRPDETKKPLFMLTDEPVRTTVSLSMPIYSKEERTAFVEFMYLHDGGHPAIATYLVDRTRNGWRTRCSALTYFP